MLIAKFCKWALRWPQDFKLFVSLIFSFKCFCARAQPRSSELHFFKIKSLNAKRRQTPKRRIVKLLAKNKFMLGKAAVIVCLRKLNAWMIRIISLHDHTARFVGHVP